MKNFRPALLFLLFLLHLASAQHAQADTRSVRVEVNGMVCAFCSAAIEKKLKAMPDTQGVYVNLAGLMLAAAGALQWHARRFACPTDPSVANACASTRDWSLIVYWVSVAMFMTGAMFAFVVPLFI